SPGPINYTQACLTTLCQPDASLAEPPRVLDSQQRRWVMAADTPKKSWIQKAPDVCGGDACVRNTRITVWGLVQSRRLGTSEAQLLKTVAGLTPDDLTVAWDYFREHPAEIDEAVRRNEEP